MDLFHLQPRVSTSTSSAFPPHRTQIHPRMHFSTFPPPHYRVDRLRVLVAGLLTVPFLLYLVSVARGTHLSSRFTVSRPKGFCVIIDARATASRVHVFEFLNDGRIPFVGFDSKGSVSLSARPGIRAFAAEPVRAGASLRGLLEFAKGRVPRSVWVETTVRLIDNGGLRGLTQEVKRVILESCRRELRDSGFLFKDYWASSITGQEKGIYVWVAANYVLGTLGAAPEDTLGIIELGEASTQVAFVIDKQHPMEFSRILELPGRTYKIYSNSTYEYSQDLTWESLQNMWSSNMLMKSSDYMNEALMSPCIPKGYNDSALQPNSMGRRISSTNLQGGFNACRANIRTFLQQKDGCSNPPCRVFPRFMPKLQWNLNTTKKFFFTSELFGLIPSSSLLDVEIAGRHYCEDPWDKLTKEHSGISEDDLSKYCFSSAYIVTLLHDILGIPLDEKRVGFMDPLERAPLDWTLGAFILQLRAGLIDITETSSNILGSETITYMSLFMVFVLAIISGIIISNWQRPKLKTIYDLEKGHYIVTRMPR